MAHLQRSVATLRIIGDDLVPGEVSGLLGCQPTHAQVKGENLPSKAGSRIARSGMWRLEASAQEPEDFDGQVAELLGKLTPDLAIWQHLADRFRMDLFCGWFMLTGNEGVSISPQTLASLGQRRIELSLDIYGPDTGAESLVPVDGAAA